MPEQANPTTTDNLPPHHAAAIEAIKATTRERLNAPDVEQDGPTPAARMHVIMEEHDRAIATVLEAARREAEVQAIRVQSLKLTEGLEALLFGYDLSVALGALASAFIKLGSQSIGFDSTMLVLVNARAQYVAAERMREDREAKERAAAAPPPPASEDPASGE